MDQELFLEHIMQYSIGAYEIIPQLWENHNKSYTFALLPHAPHLMSGVFLAAGYLLLDYPKNVLFIIPHQGKSTRQISGTIGPILWISKTLHTLDINIPSKACTTTIQDIITQHLAFVHTIGEVQNVSCILLGTQTKEEEKNLISYLGSVRSHTNSIVIENRSSQDKTNFFDRVCKSMRKKPGMTTYTKSTTNKKEFYECSVA